jgi:hypothetical protein
MSKYLVNSDYSSSLSNGVRWRAGETIEIDDVTAATINRISPGTLTPASDARSIDAPPTDRMIKRAERRQQPNAGAMSRETFKAIKDKAS